MDDTRIAIQALIDQLEPLQDDDLSHELKKQLFLDIHELKTDSRRKEFIAVRDELIALEQSLGFGKESVEPDYDQIMEHQLRLIELFESPNLDGQKLNSDDLEEQREEPEAESVHESTEIEIEEDHTIDSQKVDEADSEQSIVDEDAVNDPPKFVLIDDLDEQADADELIEEEGITQVIETKETLSDEVYDHSLALEQDKIVDNSEQYSPDENHRNKVAINLIICNCPNRDEARDIARALVEQRLAACINVIANIGAIYIWEGEIHDKAECQLQIKTNPDQHQDVIEFIKQRHSNEVPEIIIVPISQGNEDYFDWVVKETT